MEKNQKAVQFKFLNTQLIFKEMGMESQNIFFLQLK